MKVSKTIKTKLYSGYLLTILKTTIVLPSLIITVTFVSNYTNIRYYETKNYNFITYMVLPIFFFYFL